MLIASTAAGLIVGWFFKTKFLTLGFCVLGGAAGFFASAILFNLLIVNFTEEEYVLIITLVVGILIGAILSYVLMDGVIIITTSFIGSYIFVRGIGTFVGGFPSEIELYKDLVSK